MSSSTIAVMFLVFLSIALMLLSIWAFLLKKMIDHRDASVTYAVFHELSTPLQRMLGTLDNITHAEEGVTRNLEENISDVRGDAVTLVKLTENIRLLARTETPGANSPRTQINLSDVLDQVILDQGTYAKSNDVSIMNTGESKPIWVLANQSDLNRIFGNLIENSIKYRDSDKEKCFVSVEISIEARRVLVVVEDNGIGMSEEQIKSLGKRPQSRSPQNANISGSGFGLYLIKRIARQNGIKITWKSERGWSTRATVVFKSHKLNKSTPLIKKIMSKGHIVNT